MIAHIVFKDVNPYVYEITDDCRIYKNGEEIPMDDIMYHSTNGYDYVLLEQNHLESEEPKMKLYRLEFIMVSSFNPGLQNRWEWFKVTHLDGDIKNCKLNNLSWEEDVEEWRVIEYPPEIKRNMYMVSSWGRVKNQNTQRILSSIFRHDGYLQYNLSVESNVGKCVGFLNNRLVAAHFLINTNRECFDIINHIDGDKLNNHWTNLEWVSQKINVGHSVMCGLRQYSTKPSSLSTNEIDMIIDMLLGDDCKGSATKVFRTLDRSVYHNITYSDIKHIKAKNPSYFRDDSVYDLRNIEFPNPQESSISTNDVDMIITMLLDEKYGGSPSKVFEAIDHKQYPNITFANVQMTKCKRSPYIRSDSKYDLKNIEFPNSKKSKIDTTTVDMVIGMLLDPIYSGSVLAVYDAIDHDRYPHITRNVINHIKCKDKTYIRDDSQYDLRSINFTRRGK